MSRVGPSIVLSRGDIPTENQWLTKVFQEELMRVISDVPGFKWTSVWQDADKGGHFAMLSVYDSFDAGQEAWTRLLKSEALYDSFKLLDSSPDIQRFWPAWTIGSTAEALNVGEFMSIFEDDAMTGENKEILDEWRTQTRSVEQLPGFIGASGLMRAEHDDELLLTMFWRDRISFLGSVTGVTEKKTRLYVRIG